MDQIRILALRAFAAIIVLTVGIALPQAPRAMAAVVDQYTEQRPTPDGEVPTNGEANAGPRPLSDDDEVAGGQRGSTNSSPRPPAAFGGRVLGGLGLPQSESGQPPVLRNPTKTEDVQVAPAGMGIAFPIALAFGLVASIGITAGRTRGLRQSAGN